jgi:imidazolonepropionase-like amidohydrolase
MRAAMLRNSFAFAAALLFITSAHSQPASDVVLYEGARLIPGNGGAAIDESAFLVDRGVITRVGRKGEIGAAGGIKRVDLSGKTVMPTLINAHGHPGFQKGLTYAAANYTRENIVDDLNRALYFGVGAVMSQGIEKGELTFEIRAEQQAGLLGGARLLVAGRGIGAPNAGPGAPAYAGIAYEVTTEDEIRRAVREQAARKVNGIKIWVDDRGGRAPRLSTELFRAGIDEGHKLGLPVTAHVYYHVDAVDLVNAGINSLAHLVRDKEMDDALVAAIVKRNVYVMPNLGGAERAQYTSPPAWIDEPGLVALLDETVAPDVMARMKTAFATRDPAVAARARAIYANMQRSLAKLNAAGARIILGSDTGLEDHFFGYAEQRELEQMVAAGMTPAQVIVAATSRTAEFLGLKDTGALALGKRADFLVLDANPLDDIRNTRRIAKIYIGGREVDRAALRAGLQKNV